MTVLKIFHQRQTPHDIENSDALTFLVCILEFYTIIFTILVQTISITMFYRKHVRRSYTQYKSASSFLTLQGQSTTYHIIAFNSKYNIRELTVKATKGFVIQSLILDGTVSSQVPVLSGVHQGTVLGPLLLLTYINEMPEYQHHLNYLQMSAFSLEKLKTR